jgi:hypothetical protein
LRLVLFALLAGSPTIAQSTSAIVSGIVLDPSGRPVAGADVEMVNDATGIRYPGNTNSEGIYQIPNLPPGPYRLQVSKPGFKTLLKPDIVLRTEDALAVNFTLPVGAAIETVTVQGGASGLQTESAAVSTVIDHQFVENLPLNGRSFNTLLQLTPGVVIAQTERGGNESASGQFSISGQRSDANSFTVDGVSANFGVTTTGLYSGESGTGSAQAFSALGGTSSLVSVEALQEFRVETSSFAPEFGRTPGGQVMLTTRSGTNDLHGGVYEYFRNDVMDANDWFANHAGNPRAPERHNDFGGYLGGPILKSRTFYFFSYEGARLRLPQTSVIEVPYLAPAACSPPQTLAAYLDAYPKPDGPVSASACTGQFTGSYSNAAILDAASLRVDHDISARFSVFGRYNYAPSQTVGRAYSLNVLETSPVNTQTLTLGVNMLLSKTAANTLRANYSSQSAGQINSIDAFGGGTPLGPNLILGALPDSTDNASFETLDTDYYDFGPIVRNRTRQMNVVDDLTLGIGTHELKFGGDYRAIWLDKTPYQHGVNMIADTVQSFLATQSLELGASTRQPTDLLTQSQSLYGQDMWKLTPRLTLTYGARWELAPAPSPRNGTKLASWEHVNTPAELSLAPFGTPLWSTTYANLALRLGVAWRATPKGDLVLRGAVGLFYDLGVGSTADIGSYFPGEVTVTFPDISVPYGDPSRYLPEISLAPPYPLVEAISSDLKLPRSLEWNLAAEKAFVSNQIVSLTFVGQRGSDLLRQQGTYQPNANFQSDFMLTGNSAWSNYDALELQYRRPLTNHLQALLNYTWSHSLDNASSDVIAGLSGTIISGASDYASSDSDVRNSFSGALTWEVPGLRRSAAGGLLTRNWSLAGVAVARSGFPFNGKVISPSLDPSGNALSRPDLDQGQPLWIPDATAGGGRSLNPAAFVVPAAARQGTEGRNDIPGFPLTQLDLSLGRKFPIADRWGLQFRADAFNAFNHPNFTNPLAYIQFGSAYLVSQQMLNSGLGGLNPLFQEGGPRSLQLSLKLAF